MEQFYAWVQSHSIVISAIVLILAYVFIALEKIPKVTIALLGAAVVVFSGLVSQEKIAETGLNEFYFINFVDFNVIFLLVSMMIIVNITTRCGVFKWVAIELLKMTKGKPLMVLITLAFLTAILSAFLDNVTTVILIMPITFVVAKQLDINPVPLLITEIFASNDSSIVMEKLSIDSVEANQEISNALSLPTSSRVYRVQRLLSNAGIPFSYIINYIRQDVAPELPKFSNISFLNLYQLLEQEYGILFKNGTEHITAIKSDFIESQVLDINIGSPILMMTRYAQTEDDTPLEYAKTYIRPDRYSIAVHLHGWPAIGKKPMSTSLSSHFC